MTDERPVAAGRSRQIRDVAETGDEDTEGHASRLPRDDAEGVSQRRVTEGGEDDAEGHMFLSDTSAAREIARARNSEHERAARDRRLEKEARPNRQNG